MSSFKYKPDKLKYVSSISTLDEIHKKQMAEFDNKKFQIPLKKQKLESLKKELVDIDVDGDLSFEKIKKKSKIKEQIEQINDEIQEIENGFNELDYYSRTNDILFEYYNVQNDDDSSDENISYGDDTLEGSMNSINDCNTVSTCDEDCYTCGTEVSTCTNGTIDSDVYSGNGINSIHGNISQKLIELNLKSQQKRKIKKPTRKRTKFSDAKPKQNILSFFTTDVIDTIDGDTEKSEIDTTDIEKIVSNKATLFDEYMTLIDRTYIGNKNKCTVKLCTKCGIEKTLIHSEGSYVCQNCGETEHIIVESEVPNHKDTACEKPKYPYKRINHLIEWLNQFQAKESTEIPDNIYNDIITEIKRQRIEGKIKNMPYIKLRGTIKSILKKLRYTSYYEHVPYIISKVTGTSPPILNREVEDRVKFMFKQIQEPFNKYCPPDRINFLNYSYILNKLFRILEMDKYAQCFPLLKSRDKLRQQDQIWKNICAHLGWSFHPSI